MIKSKLTRLNKNLMVFSIEYKYYPIDEKLLNDYYMNIKLFEFMKGGIKEDEESI